MKQLNRALLALVVSLSLLVAVSAQVEPVGVEATLYPGESLEVQALVTTQTSLPEVDVVISMDLTGSMGDRLNNLKTEIDHTISALSAQAIDLNVGVVSHEDYWRYYYSSPCDYQGQYGDPSGAGQPFRVDYAVGSDLLAISTAVIGMSVKYQGDSPESYARVMWESGQPDSGIGYRAEAQKVLVMFVDDIPHDCGLSTGPDPGRDEELRTSDDIGLQDDAIPAMRDADIRLLVVSCGSDTALWDTIAVQTGGAAVQINADGTVPDGVNIAELILGPASKAQTQGTTDVWWGATCDPQLSVTLSPEAYYDVPEGTTVDFGETIGVPAGTEPGTYDCTVTFYAGEHPEEGAVIGVQTIRVEVPELVDSDVALDIKPGSLPNPINLKSNGVVPVALLGSEEVDVEKVDVTTLQFGPDGAKPAHDLADPGVHAGHIQDVNEDGYPDLMSHYRQEDTGLEPGDTEACLTGSFIDGGPFEACDSVNVLDK